MTQPALRGQTGLAAWPIWSLLAPLVVAQLVLADPRLWPARERAEVHLTAFDQVAQPGETITLSAKLYRPTRLGFHWNLHGHLLQFHCPPLIDREVPTGDDGIVRVKATVPEEFHGPCVVPVRFAGSSRHRPVEATARVFLWPADSPILVTDLDGTLSDLAGVYVPFTSNRDTRCLPGSVEALSALAQNYRVVYLTARDETLHDKTRAWLDEKGFPPGPLFCRDFHLGEKSQTYKRQFLAELAKRYPQLVVGVGNTVGDASAYLHNGLRPFMLDPAGNRSFPEGTVVVRSWQELRKRLEEGPENPPLKQTQSQP
jgi:hypothetical protein